jgi:DnaJ-domain-containing protein 1
MELLRRLSQVVRSRVPHREEQEAVQYCREPGSTSEEATSGAGTGPDPSGAATGTGIACDSGLRDSYANLEIPYGSDLKTAKTAWRRLMKRYHPDLHGADPRKREIATELTGKLTAAYREMEKHLKKKELP